MGKHTPGPWRVLKNLDERLIVDAKGYRIATVHTFSITDSTEANARLVVNAPRLLKALNQLVAKCNINHSEIDTREAMDLMAEIKGIYSPEPAREAD